MIRLLAFAILATLSAIRPAAAAVQVVTTTADLGSLAQEIGGDRVTVTALAGTACAMCG